VNLKPVFFIQDYYSWQARHRKQLQDKDAVARSISRHMMLTARFAEFLEGCGGCRAE
jgi:hypothetical protein